MLVMSQQRTMRRMKASLIGVGIALFVAGGCGSDDAKTTAGEPDAGTTTRTPDAYNSDCSTANWGKDAASDACWACMCGACAETLNKCDRDCLGLVQCALDEHVLVGDVSQLQCEVRGFGETCVTADSPQASVTAVTSFDTCLITSHKAPEQLRACEAECGITYTGDVCERFPEGDAGTGG